MTSPTSGSSISDKLIFLPSKSTVHLPLHPSSIQRRILSKSIHPRVPSLAHRNRRLFSFAHPQFRTQIGGIQFNVCSSGAVPQLSSSSSRSRTLPSGAIKILANFISPFNIPFPWSAWTRAIIAFMRSCFRGQIKGGDGDGLSQILDSSKMCSAFWHASTKCDGAIACPLSSSPALARVSRSWRQIVVRIRTVVHVRVARWRHHLKFVRIELPDIAFNPLVREVSWAMSPRIRSFCLAAKHGKTMLRNIWTHSWGKSESANPENHLPDVRLSRNPSTKRRSGEKYSTEFQATRNCFGKFDVKCYRPMEFTTRKWCSSKKRKTL